MLSALRFKGAWRDYQARILDGADHLFSDQRLHVVAPPGAGKTILGIEIVARLGRPALIFAPTLTIRDQWAQRLHPLFLAEPPARDALSRDLADPREITLVTYQALDAYRRGESLDALAAILNKHGPLTLVLDEAHHLRREWWSSLQHLAEALDDLRIVALTGTPPYDADHAEWERYETLCGPIDMEIGIPDLVRNGELCPHQDHVIFSSPTADTLALLDARRAAISYLQLSLCRDDGLLDDLERHPWLVDPAANVEAILDAPEMLSSVLVLLAAAHRSLPAAALDLLGVTRHEVPPLSLFWFERFLDSVAAAQGSVFAIGDDRAGRLRSALHANGLIEGGRVRLGLSRSIFRLMASSLSKLESITRIARAEHASLGAGLRMVVLADHIRADEMPASPGVAFRPAKLGVVPIFETLRRAEGCSRALAVLTGTLVIIPKATLPAIDVGAFRVSELPAFPDHLRIEAAGGGNADLVQFVTSLFEEGRITTLVGTQSLLGEGWDAPALNSLVLASNTASFMLSNQMRGRALRIDPETPGKVANIWHLATIDADRGSRSAAQRLEWGYLYDGGDAESSDESLLQRRFQGFEGIANGDSRTIESGIVRLGVDLAAGIDRANDRSFLIAADRQGTARRWTDAIGEADGHAHTRQIATPNYSPRRLSSEDTLQALAWSGSASGAFAAADALRHVDSLQGLATAGMGIAGVAALASLPKLAKAVRLFWRNGSLERSLSRVGETVLQALGEAGAISAEEARDGQFAIRSSIGGRKDIILTGVSRSAERQVMQAIAEVLGPVRNPRYLLVRSSWLRWRRRTDYHAVPGALGTSKAMAERFAALWASRVGSSKLIYTRTALGRRVLLQARARSFAAGFQRMVDRRSAWL